MRSHEISLDSGYIEGSRRRPRRRQGADPSPIKAGNLKHGPEPRRQDDLAALSSVSLIDGPAALAFGGARRHGCGAGLAVEFMDAQDRYKARRAIIFIDLMVLYWFGIFLMFSGFSERLF